MNVGLKIIVEYGYIREIHKFIYACYVDKHTHTHIYIYIYIYIYSIIWSS